MAPSRGNSVVPSVLDRLISTARGVEIGFVQPNSLRALKLALQRDLAALLNTRREDKLVPKGFKASASSLLNFGLPDFSGYSLRTPSDQNRLRRDIEAAIRIFEPRLAGVTVHFLGWDRRDPVLHFRLDGFLKIEPAPEPISFDTALHADRGKFLLKGLGR